MKAGLLRHSVAQVDAAFNTADLASFVSALNAGHKVSLRGWMTLDAQHLFG
ncbi:MAG: hypothetical protein AB8B62_13055 [Roseobacter sp.]